MLSQDKSFDSLSKETLQKAHANGQYSRIAPVGNTAPYLRCVPAIPYAQRASNGARTCAQRELEPAACSREQAVSGGIMVGRRVWHYVDIAYQHRPRPDNSTTQRTLAALRKSAKADPSACKLQLALRRFLDITVR